MGGCGLPVDGQHQTVEAAADAEETNSITSVEKTAFVSDCGRQWERDRADVAQVGVSAKVLV